MGCKPQRERIERRLGDGSNVAYARVQRPQHTGVHWRNHDEVRHAGGATRRLAQVALPDDLRPEAAEMAGGRWHILGFRARWHKASPPITAPDAT